MRSVPTLRDCTCAHIEDSGSEEGEAQVKLAQVRGLRIINCYVPQADGHGSILVIQITMELVGTHLEPNVGPCRSTIQRNPKQLENQ
jgi:hypothetical protein